MPAKGWKVLGWVAVIAAVVLIYGLVNETTDVEVFGTTVSAWLLGLVLYSLGVLAGVAARSGKPKDG